MSEDDFRQAVRQARSELRAKRFSEARVLLDQVKERYPDNLSVLRIQHDLQHSTGDYDAALETALRLAEQRPDLPQGYVFAARNLLELREIDKAKSYLDRALELHPHDLNVLHLASDFNRDQGRRQAALDIAREMIRCHPDKPDGYARAISDLVGMGEHEEAKALLAEAQEAHSDHPRVNRAALLVQRALGDHQASLESAERLLAEKPDDFNAQLRAVQTCLAVGDFDKAKRYLAGARAASPKTADRSMRFVEAAIRLYGVTGASAHLCLKAHNPNAILTKSDKQYLFVSGLARSGTTALGDLLNLSEDIALYFEILSPSRPYAQASFDDEFIKEALSTDRHRERRNAALFEKARHARYVGDKRPKFFLRLGETLQNFQGETIVVFNLVRPLRDVCRSYQARAEEPNDFTWNAQHDYRDAIIDYELMCDIFLEQAKSPLHDGHRIVFVPYLQAFTDTDFARSLFDGLTLSDRDRLDAKVEAFIAESKVIATKERPIDPVMEKNIHALANIDKIRQFEKLSGCTCL